MTRTKQGRSGRGAEAPHRLGQHPSRKAVPHTKQVQHRIPHCRRTADPSTPRPPDPRSADRKGFADAALRMTRTKKGAVDAALKRRTTRTRATRATLREPHYPELALPAPQCSQVCVPQRRTQITSSSLGCCLSPIGCCNYAAFCCNPADFVAFIGNVDGSTHSLRYSVSHAFLLTYRGSRS